MKANGKFLKNAPKEAIETWFKETDQAYYSGQSSLTDTDYDILLSIYESRFGKRDIVGYVQTREAVKLPIAMMSLDKAKTEKALDKFALKNKGPYVLSDKVNGNSALLHRNKLYNRGDGKMGTDLSYLIPYLNIPKNDLEFVKGEIVIDKKDYFKYIQHTDDSTDAKDLIGQILPFTSGLLNCKSPDQERLKLLKFIAYDLITTDTDNNMSNNLQILKDLGFNTPFFKSIPDLKISELIQIFTERKSTATYDIDGLVLCSDRKVSFSEKLKFENPSFMIAYKQYTNSAEATVESVKWKTSKNSLLKPTIIIHPVNINGYNIKSLTAFNAAWIRDNNVGKDSILLITHNTIPYILDVLESTQYDLPDSDGTWKWNESNVDIILLSDNDDVKIAKIYEFFKQISAKFWGESVIQKLYAAGFHTVGDILKAEKRDFLNQNIEGLAETGINRLLISLDEALQNISLPIIMSASCAFGYGFGTKKLEIITDLYPDVLEKEFTLEDITNIKGFAEKTAQKFLDGLPFFKKFLNENLKLKNLLYGEYGGLKQKKSDENKIQLTIVSNSKLSGNTLLGKSGSGNLPKLKVSSVPAVSSVSSSVPAVSSVVNSVPVVPIVSNSEKLQVNHNLSSDPFYSISSASETLETLIVVFTGFRDKNLEQIIKDRGGKVGTSVSRNTTCVVVGSKKTGTSKEKTATQKNIPIYTLIEFKKQYSL